MHDFFIYTESPEDFLTDLEKLCTKLAIDGDFDFELLGNEEED